MIIASVTEGCVNRPLVFFTEVSDPAAAARVREVSEAAKRNGDWLQARWRDLMPQALGKYLVVAGQQAFLADTLQEAVAQARAAHPQDRGLLVQYVRPEQGPRIYANRG